jgi:hypothetical protein
MFAVYYRVRGIFRTVKDPPILKAKDSIRTVSEKFPRNRKDSHFMKRMDAL